MPCAGERKVERRSEAGDDTHDGEAECTCCRCSEASLELLLAMKDEERVGRED
jgi:hypothetical protein